LRGKDVLKGIKKVPLKAFVPGHCNQTRRSHLLAKERVDMGESEAHANGKEEKIGLFLRGKEKKVTRLITIRSY